MGIQEELMVVQEGILLRSDKCVIPENLQTSIIRQAHADHQGITKTKALLNEKVWFIGKKSKGGRNNLELQLPINHKQDKKRPFNNDSNAKKTRTNDQFRF